MAPAAMVVHPAAPVVYPAEPMVHPAGLQGAALVPPQAPPSRVGPVSVM